MPRRRLGPTDRKRHRDTKAPYGTGRQTDRNPTHTRARAHTHTHISSQNTKSRVCVGRPGGRLTTPTLLQVSAPYPLFSKSGPVASRPAPAPCSSRPSTLSPPSLPAASPRGRTATGERSLHGKNCPRDRTASTTLAIAAGSVPCIPSGSPHGRRPAALSHSPPPPPRRGRPLAAVRVHSELPWRPYRCQ